MRKPDCRRCGLQRFALRRVLLRYARRAGLFEPAATVLHSLRRRAIAGYRRSNIIVIYVRRGHARQTGRRGRFVGARGMEGRCVRGTAVSRSSSAGHAARGGLPVGEFTARIPRRHVRLLRSLAVRLRVVENDRFAHDAPRLGRSGPARRLLAGREHRAGTLRLQRPRGATAGGVPSVCTGGKRAGWMRWFRFRLSRSRRRGHAAYSSACAGRRSRDLFLAGRDELLLLLALLQLLHSRPVAAREHHGRRRRALRRARPGGRRRLEGVAAVRGNRRGRVRTQIVVRMLCSRSCGWRGSGRRHKGQRFDRRGCSAFRTSGRHARQRAGQLRDAGCSRQRRGCGIQGGTRGRHGAGGG